MSTNIREVLDEISANKIRISNHNGSLRVVADNEESLTAEVRKLLTDNKQGLLDWLGEAEQSANTVLRAIPKADRKGFLPLSYGQQRLWFIDQLEGGSTQYNMPGVFRLQGRLRIKAFKDTLRTILERHEILRTSFSTTDGTPSQQIHHDFDLPLKRTDLCSLSAEEQEQRIKAMAAEEATTPFTLSKDLMLRAHLVKLSSRQHVLLINIHHIASDGWSLGILVREFGELYEAFREGRLDPLPVLPVQYADYARWQREWLQGEVLQQQFDYWRQQLNGLPQVHGLPLDRPRPAQQSFAGEVHHQVVGTALVEKIQRLCQSAEATLFMFLETAFAVLLSRYSGETDIVVGTPIAGRVHKDVEGLIGLFVNMLVIRNDLSDMPGFRTLLSRNKQVILSAYEHQHAPFEVLVEELQPERSLSHSPLFQVVLALQNMEGSALVLEELELETLSSESGSTKFDLHLDVHEREDGLLIRWLYSSDIFSADTIGRMATVFTRLLEQIVEDPKRPCDRYKLLDEASIGELITDTRQTFAGGLLHDGFVVQCEAEPNRPAVIQGERQLSYAELRNLVEPVAAWVSSRGVAANELVGIVMEKGWEQVVAVLSVSLSGSAYLPIDARWPEERIKQLLQQGEVKVVLTQERFIEALNWPAGVEVQAVTRACDPGEVTAGEIGRRAQETDLAYVIFTSGSTGVPKGVMIDHRGAVNTLQDINERFHVTAEDRVLAVSELHFDLSVYDVFGVLGVGGCVVLPEVGEVPDPDEWLRLSREHGVSVWNSVPALMQMLVEVAEGEAAGEREPLFRVVLLSGDWLPLELPAGVRRCFGSEEVISLGGATEASIWSICYPIGEVSPQWKSIPYGKPLANQQFYVLNGGMEFCPIGVSGDLYIGGVGLALGYWRSQELTEAGFVEHEELGERLYRTGDKGRYLADGNIEFLGREDNQVKIRGYRIELGEIEHQLSQLGSVRDQAVLVREFGNGEHHLVGYVVLEESAGEVGLDREAMLEGIRDSLRKCLPGYMVPEVFEVLSSLPLTANGKVDRESLPLPSELGVGGTEYVAPRTEVEEVLCGIWQEVLGVERVGIEDNFFALGGHSLLATQVNARVRKQFDQLVPLKQLFLSPTVLEIAEFLDSQEAETEEQFPVIVPDQAGRHEPFPLTEVQQAYLLGRSSIFDLGNVSTHSYREINLEGLDVKRLEAALNAVIRRHDMLRVVFSEEGSQRILAQLPEYEIAYLDLNNEHETVVEEQLQRLRQEMSHQVFPVEQWPLFDIRVTRTGATTYRIHFSIDILLTDGFSLNILFGELTARYLYPERDFPPLELSFRDYILATEDIKTMPMYQRARDYWVERLDSLPMAPQLPMAKAPSEIDTPRFARRAYMLDKARWQSLKDKGVDIGVTPSVLLLTAYSQILSYWSKQSHFSLNLTLFNRLPLHEQVGLLVGDFTSLILLEIDHSLSESFAENARKVQQRLWDDLEHRYFGGVEVIRELNSRKGSYQAVSMPLVFTSALGRNDGQQQEPVEETETEGGNAEGAPTLGGGGYGISQTSQVWLDHMVSEQNGALGVIWDGIEELFPAGLLDIMFSAYCELLAKLSDPSVDLNDCFRQSLPADQQRCRALVNLTQGKRSGLLLHDLFREQVLQHGKKEAVVNKGQRFDYETIDRYARGLGSRLHDLGARPNELVAVVMEKGWEQVVAVYGVLYSGGAYLPIEANLPQPRIDQLLQEAQAKIIVTQTHFMEQLSWGPELKVEGIDRERLESLSAQAEPEGYEPLQTEEDLAYVIFTSGSTGIPKGVMIDHRGAVNTIESVNEKFGVNASDKVLGLSALNFDLSVYDVFGVLGVGGTLVIPEADKEKEPWHWAELVNAEGVTLWNTVPALAQLYVDQLWDLELGTSANTLRLFLLSGDWVPLDLPERLKEFCPSSEVISLGGATEVSIWSIYYPIEEVAAHWRSIPYGKPLQNQRWYVLKPDMSECPDWAVGELYIGGLGLAKGYWRDAEKTASSFIEHPHSGERLYRTGDLGRYLPDGNIEFLGREDNQVKVHGHRIELGEIEAVISGHAQVKESAVLAVDDEESGSTQLVAYVVAEGQEEAAAGESSDGTLSDHMERINFKLKQLGLRQFEDKPYTVLPSRADADTVLGYMDVAATRAMIEEWFSTEAGEISLARWGQWLSSLGQIEVEEQLLPKRYYPSAGSLYPLQVYFYLRAGVVEQLSAGFYYYDPSGHGLVSLGQEPAVNGCSKGMGPAGFAVYVVSDRDAIEPLYGELAERFCQLEAGHVSELLLSTAPVAGIGVREFACQENEALRLALGLQECQRLECSLLGVGSNGELTAGLSSLSYLERQSYREYSQEEAVEQSALCELLAGMYEQGLTDCGEAALPLFYVYIKPQGVSGVESGVYRYDGAELVLLELVAEEIEQLHGEVNRGIYQGSGFSLFLTGLGGREQLMLCGRLGQWLMSESPKRLLGFCPIGDLNQAVMERYLDLGEGESILYTFEGGRITADQVERWPVQAVPGHQYQDEAEELRQSLLEKLPYYMVPTKYVALSSLPLTANGKVDRESLPLPSELGVGGTEYVAPRTEVEEVLCGIWQEVLGVERVGIEDNFFALGGHSLLATELISRLRREFSREIPLPIIFESPTVSGLSSVMAEAPSK